MFRLRALNQRIRSKTQDFFDLSRADSILDQPVILSDGGVDHAINTFLVDPDDSYLVCLFEVHPLAS
jgi:hypothetical protein